MSRALVLALAALAACEARHSPPDTAPDTAAEPRTWTFGRTHDGDWVDAVDNGVGFNVLRIDGLVLAIDGPSHSPWIFPLMHYTGSGAASRLCHGILEFTIFPACVLGTGGVWYPVEEAAGVEVPAAATSAAGVLWEDGSGRPYSLASLVCVTGVDGDPCLGDPGVADITGLRDAVSSAALLVSDGGRIMVANGDGVRAWDDSAPPRAFPVHATQLASGTGTLALDEAGGVWSLSGAVEERVAGEAVAIGGQLWQFADGTVVGPEPWPGEAVLQGPSLPAPATKLAGDILYGCALLDHDLWCWSAYDEGLPFADYVTSEEEQ